MLRLQVCRRCRLYLPLLLPPLLLLLLLLLRLRLLRLLRQLRPLGLRLLQPLLRILVHHGRSHLHLLRLLLLLPGGPNEAWSAILEADGLEAVAGCPGVSPSKYRAAQSQRVS